MGKCSNVKCVKFCRSGPELGNILKCGNIILVQRRDDESEGVGYSSTRGNVPECSEASESMSSVGQVEDS